MNPRKYARKSAAVLVSNGPNVTGAAALGSSSWASIAAKEVNANHKWIKFRPEDSLKRNIAEAELVVPQETDTAMRVVWIAAWGRDRPLAEVTNFLSQGPIFSMVYSPENNAVCIIFQYAASAQALLEEDNYHRERNGESMFGPLCTVVEGLAYPEDDDLQRMGNPINERRRLTFARSQLFAHGMTEDQFRRDIYGEVGEQNVELVWLFNTGNGKLIEVDARRIWLWTLLTFHSSYGGLHVHRHRSPCSRQIPPRSQAQWPLQGRPCLVLARPLRKANEPDHTDPDQCCWCTRA